MGFVIADYNHMSVVKTSLR